MTEGGGMSVNMLRNKRLAAILALFILLFSLYVLVPELRGLSLGMLAIGMLILLFLYWFIGKKHFKRHAVISFLLAVAVSAAALIYGHFFISGKIDRYLDAMNGKTHDFTGAVSDVLYEKPYSSAYHVTLFTMDGAPADMKIELSLPFDGALRSYDTVSFTAELTENDAEYDSYLKSRGVVASASAEEIIKTGVQRKNFRCYIDQVGVFLNRNFDTYIGGDAAGFASALMLGRRDNLDGQLRLACKRLGISHILAVSGLHLSVVVGGADFLLRCVAVSRRKKDGILIVLTAFFTAICGFGASVMRAALMLSLYYLADLIGQRSDSITSLFVAVTLILVLRPYSVYDAGLWLSFLSTFGILAVMPSLSGRLAFAERKGKGWDVLKKGFRYLWGLVLITLTATAFTMPVTAMLYGGVSLMAPLANLLFVPLTQLILYLLVCLSVLSFLPVLPAILGALCRTLIAGFSFTAKSLAQADGIYLSLRYPFAGIIIVILIVGIAAILLSKRLSPKWTIAVFLVCAALYGGMTAVYTGLHREEARMFVQSDGKNDAVGIVYRGKSILIDIGNGGSRVPRLAADSFADFYECEIDLLILTHLHSYHAGTLRSLADRIKIHRILLPEAENEQEISILANIVSVLDGVCEISYYPRDGVSRVEYEGLFINLPEYSCISRSDHPVVAFSVDMAGIPESHAFVYAGASAPELDRVLQEMNGSPVAVLGAHGPVMKNIFDAAYISEAESIILANRDHAFYVDLLALNTSVRYVDESEGRIDICYGK